MIYKVVGLVLAVLGLAILKYFPDVETYQAESFTLGGILVGALLILVGVGLVIFG